MPPSKNLPEKVYNSVPRGGRSGTGQLASLNFVDLPRNARGSLEVFGSSQETFASHHVLSGAAPPVLPRTVTRFAPPAAFSRQEEVEERGAVPRLSRAEFPESLREHVSRWLDEAEEPAPGDIDQRCSTGQAKEPQKSHLWLDEFEFQKAEDLSRFSLEWFDILATIEKQESDRVGDAVKVGAVGVQKKDATDVNSGAVTIISGEVDRRGSGADMSRGGKLVADSDVCRNGADEEVEDETWRSRDIRTSGASGTSIVSDEVISDRAAQWGYEVVLKSSDRDSMRRNSGLSWTSAGSADNMLERKQSGISRTSFGASTTSQRSSEASSSYSQEIPGVRQNIKDALASFQLAFVMCDATVSDWPVLYASAGFFSMTGYSAEEVVGKNCRFLQGKFTDQTDVARIREALAEGKSFTGKILNYKKDGNPFWNLLTLSPIKDNNGQIIKYIGMQAEVTEQSGVEDEVMLSTPQIQRLVKQAAGKEGSRRKLKGQQTKRALEFPQPVAPSTPGLQLVVAPLPPRPNSRRVSESAQSKAEDPERRISSLSFHSEDPERRPSSRYSQVEESDRRASSRCSTVEESELRESSRYSLNRYSLTSQSTDSSPPEWDSQAQLNAEVAALRAQMERKPSEARKGDNDGDNGSKGKSGPKAKIFGMFRKLKGFPLKKSSKRDSASTDECLSEESDDGTDILGDSKRRSGLSSSLTSSVGRPPQNMRTPVATTAPGAKAPNSSRHHARPSEEGKRQFCIVHEDAVDSREAMAVSDSKIH